MTVVVGTNDLSRGGSHHQVIKLISHNQYNPTTLKNDIGLVKLNRPIAFRKYARPISLARKDVPTNTELKLSKRFLSVHTLYINNILYSL